MLHLFVYIKVTAKGKKNTVNYNKHCLMVTYIWNLVLPFIHLVAIKIQKMETSQFCMTLDMKTLYNLKIENPISESLMSNFKTSKLIWQQSKEND